VQLTRRELLASDPGQCRLRQIEICERSNRARRDAHPFEHVEQCRPTTHIEPLLKIRVSNSLHAHLAVHLDLLHE